MENPIAGKDEKFVRLAAVCGVIAPATYILAYMIGGLIKPGYHPLTEYVSAIGVGGDVAAYIMNFGGFLPCGVFFFIFSIGLAKRMKIDELTGMAIPSIIAISGGGFVATAFVPATNGLHGLTSFFASFIQIAPLFAVYCFRRDEDWRDLWLFSLGIVIVIVLTWAVLQYIIPTLPGLYQRLGYVPVFVWVVAVAWKLHKNEETILTGQN